MIIASMVFSDFRKVHASALTEDCQGAQIANALGEEIGRKGQASGLIGLPGQMASRP